MSETTETIDPARWRTITKTGRLTKWQPERYRLCEQNVVLRYDGVQYLAYYSAYEGSHGALIQQLHDGKILDKKPFGTLREAKQYCTASLRAYIAAAQAQEAKEAND